MESLISNIDLLLNNGFQMMTLLIKLKSITETTYETIIALKTFGGRLDRKTSSERYAKTPEERARAAFRLALFLPRRWVLVLFGALRVVPFLFVWWFARVTVSGLNAGADAFYLTFDPCPVAAAVMGLLEIGLDVAESKTR